MENAVLPWMPSQSAVWLINTMFFSPFGYLLCQQELILCAILWAITRSIFWKRLTVIFLAAYILRYWGILTWMLTYRSYPSESTLLGNGDADFHLLYLCGIAALAYFFLWKHWPRASSGLSAGRGLSQKRP